MNYNLEGDSKNVGYFDNIMREIILQVEKESEKSELNFEN